MISRIVIVISSVIIVIGVVLSCSRGLTDDFPTAPSTESETTEPDHSIMSESGRHLFQTQ